MMRRWILGTAVAMLAVVPASGYGQSPSGDKMKDATKGKAYKLNLYKDAGQSTVNRAKIDLDRDDKFDEKYTFETTKITLQRAPNDDEQYTETYHWNGSGWTKE